MKGMNMSVNRPSKEEILRGVSLFLKEDLAPALQGPFRFQALISASLLDIVLRELTLDPDSFFASRNLDGLLGSGIQGGNSQEEKETNLCERIRAGDFDEGEARKRLFSYLAGEIRYKIQVDNPEWE